MQGRGLFRVFQTARWNGRRVRGEDGRVTRAERVADRDLHLQFLPWQLSGMNSLDIRLDVVFENFVTKPVYLSLYFHARSFRSGNFVRARKLPPPSSARHHLDPTCPCFECSISRFPGYRIASCLNCFRNNVHRGTYIACSSSIIKITFDYSELTNSTEK